MRSTTSTVTAAALLAGLLVAAGCSERVAPPVSPDAGPTGGGASSKASEADARGPAAPACWLEGSWLKLATARPSEVLGAVRAYAGSLGEGKAGALDAAVAEALGFAEGTRPEDILGDRPTALMLLNPKKHNSSFAAVVASARDKGVPLIAERMAAAAGAEPAAEGDAFVVRLGGGSIRFRRVGEWVAVAGSEETLEELADLVADGAAPPDPGEGYQASVSIDLRELNDAHRVEIDAMLAQARMMVALGAAQGGEVMRRLLDEYFAAAAGLLDAVDEFDTSLALDAAAVRLDCRVLPAKGSVLAPLAAQKGASWATAAVIDPEAMMAMSASFSEGALVPLSRKLAAAAARVAEGPDADAEVVKKYVSLFNFVAGEAEFSSSVSSAEGHFVGTYAMGFTLDEYRSLVSVSLGVNDSLKPMYEALGQEVTYDYKPAARRLDGRPVDRLTVTYTGTNEMARQQVAMVEAMWGANPVVSEVTETSFGVLLVQGGDPAARLDAKARALRAAAPASGLGWKGMSPELARALASAPASTWSASEMRLGTLLDIAISSLKKAQPMLAAVFPDTSALREDDAPVTFWMASEDGRLVNSVRVPVEPVANLVRLFEGFIATMGLQPPMQGQPQMEPEPIETW